MNLFSFVINLDGRHIRTMIFAENRYNAQLLAELQYGAILVTQPEQANANDLAAFNFTENDA